jgi:hypothetical protein
MGWQPAFVKKDDVMEPVTEVLRRAARLEEQLEIIRQEFSQLRKDIERLQDTAARLGGGVDCLTAAAALARDFGSDFTSQNPHALADRGDGWFGPS